MTQFVTARASCHHPPVLARVSIAVAALAAAGCGPDELAPQISELRYAGQVPQKPLVLRMDVTFLDADGDLGLGTLHLALDGEPRSELPMDQVFGTQTPELPRDARQGHFEVQVALEAPVEGGQEIEVGLWLVDRRGGVSNEPSVTLRAVTAAPVLSGVARAGDAT